MILKQVPITRGDGPYRHAIPLTVDLGGTLVNTTAEWLANDGAGHTLRMQVRASDAEKAPLLFDVTDVKIGDINGQMCIIATLWPEQTAMMPTRGTPVADIELRRRGNRVNTEIKFEYIVTGDVTR